MGRIGVRKSISDHLKSHVGYGKTLSGGLTAKHERKTEDEYLRGQTFSVNLAFFFFFLRGFSSKSHPQTMSVDNTKTDYRNRSEG